MSCLPLLYKPAGLRPLTKSSGAIRFHIDLSTFSVFFSHADCPPREYRSLNQHKSSTFCSPLVCSRYPCPRHEQQQQPTTRIQQRHCHRHRWRGKSGRKRAEEKKSYALGNSAELLGLKMSGDDSLLRGRGQCLCTQTTCDTFYRCEFAPVHLTEEGGKKIPLGLKGSNDTSSQERYVSEFWGQRLFPWTQIDCVGRYDGWFTVSSAVHMRIYTSLGDFLFQNVLFLISHSS